MRALRIHAAFAALVLAACQPVLSDLPTALPVDQDTDGDGVIDARDACTVADVAWTSGPDTDHDGDGCRDLGQDTDDDADGVPDERDRCASGALGWTSNTATDLDGDGCRDEDEDDDVDGDGLADDVDGCPAGETGWTSGPASDRDGDGCRDASEDADDDGDGLPDASDACPYGAPGVLATSANDRDGDGCLDDGEDNDDDGDGRADAVDACPAGALGWRDTPGADLDGDGCEDATEDDDDDGDGLADTADACARGETAWRSGPANDHDGDGCHDALEDSDDDGDARPDASDACPRGIVTRADASLADLDGDGCFDDEDLDVDGDGLRDLFDACPRTPDPTAPDLDGDGCVDGEDPDRDGDGVPDAADACVLGETGWRSEPMSDRDGDGCRDLTEDSDDDGDGLTDAADRCPAGLVRWQAGGGEDPDADGCENLEDDDDDGDGRPDGVDACALGLSSGPDRDGDGCKDEEDPDDDDDGVGDAVDACPRGESGWHSSRATDHDGDGCRDATEDDDDDQDTYADTVDVCARGTVAWVPSPSTDLDGDGCESLEDSDDDGDGLPDGRDACPDGAREGTDRDGDGCKDSEDDDDDGDGVGDASDLCITGETGWSSGPVTDRDGDGCRDATEDNDDDGDGVVDAADACREGALAWTSGASTDHDADGCRDQDEDGDDDADGIADAVDACPRGERFVSSAATDFDRDGCRDGDEDADDDNDGVTDPQDVRPLDPRRCSDGDADGCDDCSVGVDGTGPLGDRDPANDGPDADADGRCDENDRCPFRPDPTQADWNADGIGDACEGLPDFEPRAPVSSGLYGVNGLVTFDIDADGDLDFIATSGSSGNVPVYNGSRRLLWIENVGGRADQWVRRTIDTPAQDPANPVVADFDRDGDPDLAVRIGAEVRIYWNGGRAASWTHSTVDGATSNGRVFGADIDGDSDVDLVTSDAAGLRWFRNDRAGHWTGLGGPAGVSVFALADMDRDGDVDVAVVSGGSTRIEWLENVARDGTDWSVRTVSSGDAAVNSLVVADLDGDGWVDMASTQFVPNHGSTVRWHRHPGTRDGAWVRTGILAGLQPPALNGATDIDGDGDADLLLTQGYNGSSQYFSWIENQARDASRWRLNAQPSPPDGWASQAGAADLDGDGDLDLYCAFDIDGATPIAETLAVYLNRKLHRSARFDTTVPVMTVSNPNAIFPSDLDRDGKVDLVVANGGGAFVGMHGAPTFDARQVASAASFSLQGIGDLDGDTVTDLLFTRGQNYWLVTGWLKGTTSGLFGPETIHVGFGSNPLGGIGDLDGDGRLDVTATAGAGTHWYSNVNGNGTGLAMQTFTSSAIYDTRFVDLDGDGAVDIIGGSTATGAERLDWWRNTGSFATPASISTRPGLGGGFAIGDVTRDGAADVVAMFAGGLYVYDNRVRHGEGFAESLVNDLAVAGRAELADVDADGDLDIVTNTSDAGVMSWYANGGDGRAWSVRRSTVGTSNPFVGINSAFKPVDWNRDGAIDLAAFVDVANSSDDFVGFVPNRGAQFSVATMAVTGVPVRERTAVPVLRVEAAHRGKTGDLDAVWPGLRLRLQDGAGAPLSPEAALQRITRIDVALDITPGTAQPTYEPGVDEIVATVGVSRVTDAGELYVTLPPSGAGRFTAGTAKRFWVLVQVAAGAATAPAKSFRVGHAVANNATRVFEASSFRALSLEVPVDVTSATLTPVP